MSLAAIILNGAYVAFVGSAYTRTLAWLRVLLIIGGGLLIVFGAMEQIWPMVGWNIVIVSSHIARIIGERRAQNSVQLTAAESALRDEVFPEMSDFDFNLLWSMGSTVAYDDELMIAEGSRPHTVSLVTEGLVAIEKSGETKRGLRRGALIGEMSFVSGAVAAVDVLAKGPVMVQQWDQRQLTSLDQAHPPSAKAFRELVARDLANKAHFALS